MRHVFPATFLVLLAATMAVSVIASHDHFTPIPSTHPKVIAAAEAAVYLHNYKQNNVDGGLELIGVQYAQTMDRGAAHYTYKMLIEVNNEGQVEKYHTVILEDLGAPGQPPVYNFGSFVHVY